MNVPPLVSVVLCNYNYAQFVGEAIESVLAQTHPEFELIIVDDGSTDGSREVISSYVDQRIHTLFHEENRGQAAAFNTGFAEVTGSFVAFLDSDDKWMPEKLARVLHVFQRQDLSVVQHNLEVIDSDSRQVGTSHPGMQAGIRDVVAAYLAENRTGFFTPTSGITCPRSVLQSIFPLPEHWHICADIPLTRPLPLFGLVCTLGETLGYYRVHGSNSWMHTEGQGRWLENEQRYIECANEWLARCGYSQRIDLTKSAIYQRWCLEQLPTYHPRRWLARIRPAVAKRLPEPVKAVYRACKRLWRF
jgi:glycosyltransferase involved in cell wall biosynthesis